MVDLSFFSSSCEKTKKIPMAGRFLRPVNVVQIVLNPGGTWRTLTSSKLSNWIWAVAASSEHPSLKSPTSWVLLTILAQLHSLTTPLSETCIFQRSERLVSNSRRANEASWTEDPLRSNQTSEIVPDGKTILI